MREGSGAIRVPDDDPRVLLRTHIADRHADARPARRARDDEDAAVVVTVLAALAVRTASGAESERAEQRSIWGRPGFEIAGAAPGPHTWWASGLPQ